MEMPKSGMKLTSKSFRRGADLLPRLQMRGEAVAVPPGVVGDDQLVRVGREGPILLGLDGEWANGLDARRVREVFLESLYPVNNLEGIFTLGTKSPILLIEDDSLTNAPGKSHASLMHHINDGPALRGKYRHLRAFLAGYYKRLWRFGAVGPMDNTKLSHRL